MANPIRRATIKTTSVVFETVTPPRVRGEEETAGSFLVLVLLLLDEAEPATIDATHSTTTSAME